MTTDNTAFLFLVGSIEREGGIESIVLRTTRFLAERGMPCAVLVAGTIPDGRFHPDVVAISMDPVGLRKACTAAKQHLGTQARMVVISFDPTTASYGVLAKAYLQKIGARPAYQAAMAKAEPGFPPKLD